MGRADEERDIGDERTSEAAGETQGDEDEHGTRGTDEEADGDDEESLHRLDQWLTKEHDRIASDAERLDDAAKPLGRIEFDPSEVLDAQATKELGQASQMEPVHIDSRIERMDDEDKIPTSEYGLLAESKVRIVDAKLADHETAQLLSAGWVAVERDQLEAVADAIDGTRINSAQAVAITMMLVSRRIGEYRMRDLIETMSQAAEIPTGQTPTWE